MKNFITQASRAIVGKKGRWITLGIWVALIVALQLLLPASGDYTDDTTEPLPDDQPSIIAADIMQEYFPSSDGLPGLITWYREDGIQEEDLAAIQELSASLTEDELNAQEAVVPYQDIPYPALQEMISEDGTTFIQTILFQSNVSSDETKEGLTQLTERVNDQLNENPFESSLDSDELVARVTGPAGISVDATELFENADVSLLIGTVVLVLVFLLLIYRSPILPFIPLLAVGAAYAVATPILGWMAKSGIISYDSQGIAIMTVLLFGAGTDYCLFLIARFRLFLYEEQNRLKAIRLALTDTAGVIGISGLTVVSALMALLISQYGTIHNFAVPFGLSIFVMMISSITLVPALLSMIGRMAFYPFVPRTEEMEHKRAKKKNKKVKIHKQSRFWHRIGDFAAQKPIRTIVITLVLLVGSSLFVTQVQYSYDTLSSFPEDTPSREGFALISDAFGSGDLAPVQVVFDTGGEDVDLTEELGELGGVYNVEEPEVSEVDDHLVMYQLELTENPYSNEAMDDLEAIQANVADLKDQYNLNEVWIGGQTAEQVDQRSIIETDEFKIIALVVVIISILLLIYLRSITAMIYLVGTVLVSYTSALGLGWVILHYGFDVPSISALIPIYAFVFIAALGEDYNIFMISNIWEKKRKLPLKPAIREGVGQSGGVITSAGVILAGTFAVLTTLPIQVLVQFGLITAIGVLLDTFIVRPLLVPAITSLLGKWAFWPSKQMEKKSADTEN
ncbi:MMPL family transporter [Alkalicoccobacillus murimartini]|uniref:RND superfamily putative drug exporter n=1 Tax=Alkalicoccobacillus murimartini TaxID=171685 RepID=A0ABT9YLM0_9BACI|nr:MMPL family transporter [Alkalicoccobacillus murimartini]MDQ0208773.1 RND superfamily putative drug exporter [Alkalicoccobacillus murimartini]